MWVLTTPMSLGSPLPDAAGRASSSLLPHLTDGFRGIVLIRVPTHSNTANETMVEDYVQSHLAGMPVFRRGKDGHKQTLSCFDKTR